MSDDKQDKDAEFAAEDAQEFAKQFQDAVQSGGFNPFSLLTGDRRYHSIFLAPFSRSMQESVDRFLQDGTGPLQSLVEQLRQQGAGEQEAKDHATGMLQAADGMCVVVMQDDQGLVTIPQLFFGHLEEVYTKQVVELCGDDFPDKDGLKAALIGLKALAERGMTWPGLFVAVDGTDNPARYWEDLSDLLLEGVDEGLFAAAPDRIADLGHWSVRALGDLAGGGAELDGDQLYSMARCATLARDMDAACIWAGRLLDEYEPEDEALALLIEQMASAAIIGKQADRLLAFFEQHSADLDAVLGGCYELELPRFRTAMAAVVDTDAALAAAERLHQADRKSFRHALNREPLWQVGVEPEELLDTHAAADRLERSINFVSKRLESGTLPFWRDGEELRIPAAALDNWQAIMERYSLLD